MRFVCSLIPRLTRYDKHVITVNESQIICYLFSTIDLHSTFSTSRRGKNELAKYATYFKLQIFVLILWLLILPTCYA